MTNEELKKIVDRHDVVFIALGEANNMQCAMKGSVSELIASMGMMIVDIHKQSGVDLAELGKKLNMVVARVMEEEHKDEE